MLNPQSITINEQDFSPNPACNYKHDYFEYASLKDHPEKWEEWKIPAGTSINDAELAIYRYLVLNDLWFIIHFVLKIPNANRPFIVQACRDIEDTEGWTLNLYARAHYKSTIRKARNIQRLVKYPNKCQMIVSHTRPAAKKHLRPIMLELENNLFLKTLFPDRLYSDPRNESPKWSEDDGLIEKCHQNSRPETNIEAWGIKDGMPIGVHFDFIDIDDLETKEDVKNPDVILKCRESVDLCNFLLSENGVMDFWGTPYSHEGIYIPHILEKKKPGGEPKYKLISKPATCDGTITGKPVLWSQEKFDEICAELEKDEGGIYAVNCQLLVNPTPIGSIKLNPQYLNDIEPEMIPKNIVKIMAIDPAGDGKTGKGDAWASLVIGIDTMTDSFGANNIYILDAIIALMNESEAPMEIVRQYIRNGIIQKIGVEKVGQATAELHIKKALSERGHRISEDDGTLVILRPGGKDNTSRINTYVQWHLNNNKIYISKSVRQVYRERLKTEMSKFPFWHDDGLTALAYAIEMSKDMDMSIYRTDRRIYRSKPYELATVVG